MAVIRGTNKKIPNDVTKAARDAGFYKADLYSGRVVVKDAKVSGQYGGSYAKTAAKTTNGGGGRGSPKGDLKVRATTGREASGGAGAGKPRAARSGTGVKIRKALRLRRRWAT
jgi:hypothetical protein